MTFDAVNRTPEFPGKSHFEVMLGIRPEKLQITQSGETNAIDGTVYSTQPAGSETTAHIRLHDVLLMSKEIGIKKYAVDEKIGIRVDSSNISVYDAQTQRLIQRCVPD